MKKWLPYSAFILAFMLVLYLLTFIFTDGKMTILGWEVKYPSYNDLMASYEEDTNDVVDVAELTKDIDTSLVEEQPLFLEFDSTELQGSLPYLIGEKGKINFDTAMLEKMKLPESSNPFQALYNGLIKGKNSSTRIAHYGDSQIEGDRLTGYMRQRLQSRFGGNGPGFIAGQNVYNTVSFDQEVSDNIQRFTVFGARDKRINHKSYGYMGSIARYTAPFEDSIIADSVEATKAWISVGPHKAAFKNSKYFNKVTLYLGNVVDAVKLRVRDEDSTVILQQIIDSGATNRAIPITFTETPAKVVFEFESKVSPDIYGFDLSSDKGVAVDNIAMRGAIGTFAGVSDWSSLSYFYNKLDVDFFIMEFGGNAVPFLKDSAAVEKFARRFGKQLSYLKKLRPNCGILVIGPADMSQNNMGKWETYDLLPYTIQCMIKESNKQGAAYWDMYSAMGGKNSMPRWVDDGLAAKDYIHFSYSGAKFVGQMLYESILYELAKFDGKSKNGGKK